MKKFILLLLIIFGIFGWSTGQIMAQRPRVAVPSVIGDDVGIASQKIIDLRLRNDTIINISDNRPAGTVIRQFPAAGAVVDIGMQVNLYVSTGPPPVIVPSVIGNTREEAQEILSASQLLPGNLNEQPSDAEPGRIIFQDPPAGASVGQKTAVNLTIAMKAPVDYIIVPDVIKLSLEQAREVLDKTGLIIGQVNLEYSNVPEGMVIGQFPQAGERTTTGSPVTLTLAQPIQIPSNPSVPPWIYWGCGIVATVLLSGFIGWKSGKGQRKNKTSGKKDPELRLVKLPDVGKQTIRLTETGKQLQGLQLKIIPDKGIQTIKTN